MEALDQEPVIIGFEQLVQEINAEKDEICDKKNDFMTNPEPEAEHINSLEISSMVEESVLKTEKIEENDIEKNTVKPPFLNLSSTNFINSQNEAKNE